MRGILVALALSSLVGCAVSDVMGSGSGGDSRPSAAQANAFAEQFGEALSNGVASVAGSGNIIPQGSPTGLELSVVPICGQNGCLFNEPITARTTCTAGGRIEVNGSMTGSLSLTGSGTLLIQVLETITDWRCVLPYVFNGDPYLSVAGTIPFLNGQISSAAVFDIGGGFKWGTGASDTFQINLTLTLDPDGSGRMSGVMGPYSIDATF